MNNLIGLAEPESSMYADVLERAKASID